MAADTDRRCAGAIVLLRAWSHQLARRSTAGSIVPGSVSGDSAACAGPAVGEGLLGGLNERVRGV